MASFSIALTCVIGFIAFTKSELPEFGSVVDHTPFENRLNVSGKFRSFHQSRTPWQSTACVLAWNFQDAVTRNLFSKSWWIGTPFPVPGPTKETDRMATPATGTAGTRTPAIPVREPEENE